MEENVASIDECVCWLEQDVLDLLSLRRIVTKLSTNWQQLKLSLREKGLLRDTQFVDDLQGPTPPTIFTENARIEEALIGPVRPTDTRQQNEFSQSTESTNTKSSSRELFIGPVIPTDAMRSSDKDVELIRVEPGPSAVGFIGPVIPGDAAESTSEHGESVDQQNRSAVDDESTELKSEQNENGSMETSESATVQSSGLQMS